MQIFHIEHEKYFVENTIKKPFTECQQLRPEAESIRLNVAQS